jgi:hypothetical protein
MSRPGEQTGTHQASEVAAVIEGVTTNSMRHVKEEQGDHPHVLHPPSVLGTMVGSQDPMIHLSLRGEVSLVRGK